jgi:DNA polymerase-3 subunit epsilon
MTGGQTSLFAEHGSGQDNSSQLQDRKIATDRQKLKIVTCSKEELLLHQQRMEAIDKESGGSVWSGLSE